MARFITTPDSVPSLADCSFASSDIHDDSNDSEKVLLFESPTNVEVYVPVTNYSKWSKVLVVSPDSSTTTTNSILSSSELLSVGSDDWLSSPSIIQQQKNAFRTADCKDVLPSFTAPVTLTDEEEVVEIFEREISSVEDDDDDVMKVSAGKDDETLPKLTFCSNNFMSPSGANIFHMFDISPQIWPGWSLMSPKQRKEAAHGPIQGIDETTSSYVDLSQSSPSALSQDTRFVWSPLDRRGIDPVFETFTPPRKSASRDMYHGSDHGGKRLSQIFEEYANDDFHEKESSTHSEADSQTDVETTVASNVDMTGSSNAWERKVDDLERSCATLKEIIRCDSKTMLQLKTDISMLRESSNISNCTNFDKTTILSLQTELRRVKAERDALRDRELQLVNTIETLKDGIHEGAFKTLSVREVNGYLIERKLLTKQLLETKLQLKQAKLDLMVLLKENIALKAHNNHWGPGYLDVRAKRKRLDWNPRGTLTLNTLVESEQEETIIFESLDETEESSSSVNKQDGNERTGESSNRLLRLNEYNDKSIHQITEINDGSVISMCGLFGDYSYDRFEMIGECINDTVLNEFERSYAEEANIPLNEVEVTLDGLVIATALTATSLSFTPSETVGYYNTVVDKMSRNTLKRSNSHDSNKESTDLTRTTSQLTPYLVAEQRALCCDLCGCFPQSHRVEV